MIKLTKAGKIVVGCLAALFIIGSYMLFFSGDEAPPIPVDADGIPYSEVVTTPKAPFTFPLSDEQSAQWHKDAQVNLKWLQDQGNPLSYCSMMGTSTQQSMRRHPIEFLAIVGDPNSPYHISNAGGSGKEIYPVYPIENKDGGERLAIQAMGGGGDGDTSTTEQLTTCGIKVQGQDAAVPVLLEYPKGAVPIPQNQIVRVQGFIGGTWGPSGSVPGPLVMAGRTERAFGQEVFAPTLPHNGTPMEFDLNVDLRHAPSSRNGGLLLHLGKIQYAARQTRIWVKLTNKTTTNYPDPWTGIQDSKLQGPEDSGVGQDICQGGFCPEDQSIQTGELQPQVEAGLLQAKPLPAGTSTQGWLVFPRMDYGPVLTLRMPDLPPFDQAQNANNQLPLIVKIRPPR